MFISNEKTQNLIILNLVTEMLASVLNICSDEELANEEEATDESTCDKKKKIPWRIDFVFICIYLIFILFDFYFS